MSRDIKKIIPVECFLNRVFPASVYKKDASSIIEYKIFKPRKDCEDFTIKFPVDWEALDKKEDRNWRMQLQGWAMFHPIMNFFDGSDEKDKIMNYFFEVCCDWNIKYGDDPANIVTSRMPESYTWYDMSVGFRALVIAFFLDRIDFFNIEVSEINRILLNKLAIKHIDNLKRDEVFSLNNHGMFQIQGLMALIQLDGIEKYREENLYALEKMEELVLSQYDNNGVHLEHSPHYHFYALTTFENLLVNDWYDDKPIIKQIVIKAQSIKKWLVDPYARPACIGDSIMTVQKSVDFNNKSFSKELEVVTDDKQFVYSNFNDSGYSVFRSRWDKNPEDSTYLFFMGMYNRKTHKHRDCLSFEWFDNGDKILCDSGKYGYISDKYRNYFLSNRAHNTVEIEGFDILKIKPYGSAIKSSSYKNNIFTINSKLDYPAIKFDRTLYLKSNKWLVVVDELNFKRARQATQWFHIEKSYKLISSSDNLCTFKKNDKSLIIHNLNTNTNNSIFCGDKDNMQGFVSENDFVYDDGYALGFDFHGKNETLVTILALNNESYFEALTYVKNEDLFQLDLLEPDKFLTSNSLIKNIKHKSYVDCNIDFINGKNTYSIFENEMRFDFYLDKKNSKEIVVMLPGAIDRSKKIYNFQRHSWSNDVDYSLLSMLDPTVREDNEISIGWFQGLGDNYAGDNLVKLLKKLFFKNNVDESDVTFFGSSAGGFSSLKLANDFPCSKIIAINPQIYIYNYSENEFSKLLKYTFFNEDKNNVINKNKDRLSVNIDFTKRAAPIYYYQNTSDLHHMSKHLEVYLATLNNNDFQVVENNKIAELKKLNVLFYEDSESGHSPPNKMKTIEIINNIIQNFRG